ncbi:MAG: hypothetical protein NC311_05800 [Muribaculaceae bacterium]|nr:hypothetical protein [Muribaculaceae bacterium]
MRKHNHHKKAVHNRDTVNGYSDKPKVVAKRYNVTSQTAYHITELALREGTTEGRIIDKIMRTYLATQRFQGRDYT